MLVAVGVGRGIPGASLRGPATLDPDRPGLGLLEVSVFVNLLLYAVAVSPVAMKLRSPTADSSSVPKTIYEYVSTPSISIIDDTEAIQCEMGLGWPL